jgi:hypothetical protein
MKKSGLAIFSLLVACSGTDLDVGHDAPQPLIYEGGGTGGSAGSGMPVQGGNPGASDPGSPVQGGSPGTSESTLPMLPAQSGCRTDPALAALVGTWDGDVEDFFLASVVHARLVIAGASSDGICGSITYGTSAALPPADDPDAPYPPSEYAASNIDGCSGPFAPYECVIEGFPYTIAQGGARLPTVRLETIHDEPWQSWCELQTPSPNAVWSCIDRPDGQLMISIGANEPSEPCTISSSSGSDTYTSFKCVACGVSPSIPALCVCDGSSCGAAQNDKSQYDLALSDDGKSLSGAFPTTTGEQLTLHVTRVND